MGRTGGSSGTWRLRALLADTVELLEQHGEHHWSEALRTHLERVDENVGGAETAVLGLYGGMGSFNDLVIHPINGHTVAVDEVGPVNDKLSALRSAIWTEAVALRSGQATGETPTR